MRNLSSLLLFLVPLLSAWRSEGSCQRPPGPDPPPGSGTPPLSLASDFLCLVTFGVGWGIRAGFPSPGADPLPRLVMEMWTGDFFLEPQFPHPKMGTEAGASTKGMRSKSDRAQAWHVEMASQRAEGLPLIPGWVPSLSLSSLLPSGGVVALRAPPAQCEDEWISFDPFPYVDRSSWVFLQSWGVSYAGCGHQRYLAFLRLWFCSQEPPGLGLAAVVGGDPWVSQRCGHGAPRPPSQGQGERAPLLTPSWGP